MWNISKKLVSLTAYVIKIFFLTPLKLIRQKQKNTHNLYIVLPRNHKVQTPSSWRLSSGGKVTAFFFFFF